MADSLNLRAVIDFLMGKRGDKDATKGLKGLGDQAKKTQQDLKKTGTAAEGLGKKLVQFLGAAVIARLVTKSVVEFAKYNRILGSIEEQLGRMGLAHEGAMDQVKGFLEGLETVTGTLRQETAPVFQKFLGMLGDVEAAMAATSLATDLSARGLGGFKDSAEALSMVILGEATEAMKKFGVEQTVTNEAGLNNVEVLRELIEKNKDFAATVADSQSEVEKMGSTWNDITQTIGEGFAPALSGVNTVIQVVIKSIQTLGAFIGGVIQKAVFAFQDLGGVIGAALNFKLLVTDFSSFTAIVKSRVDTFHRDQLAANVGMGEAIAEIWAEAGETAAVEFDEGFTKILEKGAIKQADRRKAQADREAEERQKELEALAQMEEGFRQRLMTEEIRAAEELSDVKLKLELDLLDRQFRAAIALAKAKGADVADLEAAHQLARQNLITETEESQADAVETAIKESQRAREEELKKQLEAIEKMKAAQEKAREDRMAGASEMVGALGGLMGGMFGAAKATAVAQAVINTYEGATKALAQGGFFGGAMAALVIAMGLAHVATIRSSEPGSSAGASGFDDPENDRLARVGGRNWARDALRHISTGFAEELAAPTGGIPVPPGAGPGAPAGSKGDTYINLTVNGLYGGPPGLRQLTRKLRRATQQDRSREIA